MTEVLVLNTTYEPLKLVSIARAIRLLITGKAEVVEHEGRMLRSASGTMAVPLVVRLLRYVAHRRVRRPAVSRRAVLLRDGETCQYCGAQPGRARLTLDHVVPRAQGGPTSWENVVACCASCNQRKADRTPEQAGMRLARLPRQPVLLAAHRLDLSRRTVWERYGFR